MNFDKIDKILQYILLVAGQEDDYFNRELGPIHFLKYLYLVDLAYADKHNGEIFTGIPWKFHHFGPWSLDAYQRIEPALLQVGAKRKSFRSQYKDDVVRWSLQDDYLSRQIVHELPFQVTHAVQKYVHQFNSDTENLLHFVYNTHPILHAKPGDLLDFSFLVPVEPNADRVYSEQDTITNFPGLSVKKRREKEKAVQEVREKLGTYLEKKKSEKRIMFPKPLYDDVFYEALETFDALADTGMKETEGVLHFSDDMWKSKARFDPDVS